MKRKTEQFEWIHSWADDTWNEDLPRVLLVGDSICQGYQEKVREALRGVCCIDYLATSYAIDSKIYNDLVYAFIKSNKYTILHINHGLHGEHMSKRTYKSRLQRLLDRADSTTKIILATSTYVYAAGNKEPDALWMKLVNQRNQAMKKLCEEKGYAVDDLYAASLSIAVEDRHQDGTHYEDTGYAVLAEAVVKSIQENL